MIRGQVAFLTSALFLFSTFSQDMPQNPVQSDREKAGYAGPVRKASTETETLSRKLYRESGGGQTELVEDTTAAFGNGRFLAEEQEFDQNGRLIADANSDREAEQEPFRSAYSYDTNGRLSLEVHFNRDGSLTGRKQYVYDAGGKKTEELFYAASGVLQSKVRYDNHQNTTDIESYAPSGAIVQKQSINHSYRREGNTLEDSYTSPQPTSGMYLRAVSPKNGEPEAPSVPQQFKVVYTYNDSGQVIKEVVAGGWEKTYDSKGRLTEEVFGNTRTAYFYDERGHITEMLVHEPPGAYLLSGGNVRYVYKYDSYGNEKEQIVTKRDGSISMHRDYTYEYDSHGNWTKRIEHEKVFNFREDIKPSTLDILSAEYRTLSYH
jgi:YD repeat-containing protein